jgi:glycosyltransferase involved in cell wall biosynthesis
MVLDIFIGPGRRRLAEYIRSLDPDVVHFQETHGLGLSDIDLPSLFTVHGFDSLNLPTEKSRYWALRSQLWRLAEDFGLRRQHTIVSIAPYVTRQIQPHTRAQIVEINNAIHDRGFSFDRSPVPGRVFFAGWINQRKNALGLVEAFNEVARLSPNAELRLAGEFSDTGYKAQVDAAIRKHELANRVTLLGRISADEVRAEMSQAEVFVLPSFQENAPMVIAEAMAAGVPVVTSNVCGMPDMVEHGETGFLFAPEDTQGFASAILDLIVSPDLQSRMSSNAKRSAREKFHPRQVAERTLEVYRDAIRQYGRAPVSSATQ